MSLVVVSNRLPVVLDKTASGSWSVKPGAGGLVTALRPILKNRGGRWIGWTGALAESNAPEDSLLSSATRDAGYALTRVPLSRAEYDNYYLGFGNEVIWPLFHDFPSLCNFERRYWECYRGVNRKFAEITAEVASPGDLIWVHDYHLMNVGRELATLRPGQPRAFFLHIPFPPLDLFLTLPWRSDVLRGLLEFDLVGFQTLRDRRNFLHCVRALLPDVETAGKGSVVRVRVGARELRVGAFPISIDFSEFSRQASQDAVKIKAASLRADETGRKIILGADRLDYTKGIALRFRAFERALELHPELVGGVTFLQIVVPSREAVPGYAGFKAHLEQLVGAINGRFTRSGWVPIHYIFRNMPREKLLAYYRAADVALVTPLKDGMNLVAKEYCAVNVSGDGVLILSEFAGAAAELQRDALLVNPRDIDGVAAAIFRAVRMPEAERRSRMHRLRRIVRSHNIFRWLDLFLEAAFARELSDFPVVDPYFSQTELFDELSPD